MKVREKGFTSVELTIALLISSIIIGFIYAVYHFSLSYSRKWEQKIALENNVFLIMNQISADIRRGVDIFNSRSNYFLIQNTEGNINYCFTVDSLERNNFTINSESCRLDTFYLEVQSLRTDDSWGEQFEYYSLGEKSNDSLLYVSDVFFFGLKMSNGTRNMELRSSVFLRNRSIARFNRLLREGYDE
ncbi:MAG: hypothetical protein R6V04_03315 [bacterium]